MPDYKTDSGVVVRGCRPVLTADGWRNNQIRVITLTDRALALWDRSTGAKACDIMPHFAHLLTAAKLADRSNNDLVGKPTKYDNRNGKNDIVESPDADVLLEGKSTSPKTAPSKTTPPTSDVEQHASSVPPTKLPTKIRNEAPTGSKRISDSGSDNRHLGQKSLDRHHGTSFGKPKSGSRDRKSWAAAKIIILNELRRVLKTFPRRHANAVYSRANWELLHGDSTCKPSTNWPYWISRFPNMPPEVRNYHMRRDILPTLLSSAAIPDERRANMIGHEFSDDIAPSKHALSPFFRKIWSKFVDGDKG